MLKAINVFSPENQYVYLIDGKCMYRSTLEWPVAHWAAPKIHYMLQMAAGEDSKSCMLLWGWPQPVPPGMAGYSQSQALTAAVDSGQPPCGTVFQGHMWGLQPRQGKLWYFCEGVCEMEWCALSEGSYEAREGKWRRWKKSQILLWIHGERAAEGRQPEYGWEVWLWGDERWSERCGGNREGKERCVTGENCFSGVFVCFFQYQNWWLELPEIKLIADPLHSSNHFCPQNQYASLNGIN